MKRIIIITLLLLIALLALTACGGKKEKKETVYDILADVIDKTVDSQKSESTAVWEEALKNGSIEELFTYNSDLIPIKTISGKTYFNKDSSALLASLALTTGEKLDLSLFSDQKKSVLTSSALTKNYGFTSDGLISFVTKYFLSADEEVATFDSTVLVSSLEKHETEFRKLFETNVPVTMKKAESSLQFSFTVSNKTLKKMLSDAIAILEKDADFSQTLVDYVAANGETLTATEIYTLIKEELKALDEEPFNAMFAITASNDRIITAASINVYDSTEQNPNVSAQKRLASVLLSLPASGGFNIEITAEGQTITAGYTVTEFGTVTKETLSIGAMGVSLTPVSLTYDSATTEYELKIEIPGKFSATAKGKYTATKTQATLTLTSLVVTLSTDYSDLESILSGNTTIDLPMTLTLTAKTEDIAPKAPASYTDIATLSEKDAEALMTELMSDPVVQSLAMIFGSFSGSNVEKLPEITK